MLVDRQRRKHAPPLRHDPQALPADLVWPPAGDIHLIEDDAAGARRREPRERAAQGRLADAVAAQHRDHRAWPDFERHPLEPVALAVVGVEISDDQHLPQPKHISERRRQPPRPPSMPRSATAQFFFVSLCLRRGRAFSCCGVSPAHDDSAAFVDKHMKLVLLGALGRDLAFEQRHRLAREIAAHAPGAPRYTSCTCGLAATSRAAPSASTRPWYSTVTVSAMANATSMSCSISRTAIAGSSPWISWRIASRSVPDNPAIGSSSSSSRGRPASASATSSFRWSPYDRCRTRSRRKAPSPKAASSSSARATIGVQRSSEPYTVNFRASSAIAANRRLSSTVSSGKSRVI